MSYTDVQPIIYYSRQTTSSQPQASSWHVPIRNENTTSPQSNLSNQATKQLVPLSLSSSRFSTMCTVLFAMSMQPSNSTTHQRPKQHTLLHNVGSLGVNDHETKQLYNPPEPQINQFSIRWTCSHATKQPMHPFLSNTCFSTMCTGLVRNDHAAEQLYKPPTPQTITHVSRQYGQSWPQ